jgi:hypothetical protein
MDTDCHTALFIKQLKSVSAISMSNIGRLFSTPYVRKTSINNGSLSQKTQMRCQIFGAGTMLPNAPGTAAQRTLIV